jgi:RND family efflux transporter MFP subunit
MTSRFWLWIKWSLGIGLLAVLAGSGLWLHHKASHARTISDPERARLEGKPIPIRTDVVQETQAEQVVGGTALTAPSLVSVITLAPSHYVSSNAPITDIRLKVLHGHDGEHVRKGQVLAELDDRLYRESLKQQQLTFVAARAALDLAREQIPTRERIRELELASAHTEIKYRTEDLDNKRDILDIYTKLKMAPVVATSQIDYLNARSVMFAATFARAEAETALQKATILNKLGKLNDAAALAKTESDYEAAQVALMLAEHDTERLKITSPLDGYLDFQSKDEPAPGSSIAINQPLCSVLQLDPLLVRMDFPQERIDDVAVGQSAEVVLDSYPKETFQGTVTRIAAQANAQLRVVPVVIEIKNPNGRIKAGISGFVRVRMRKSVKMTIPAAATIQRGGKSMVFCVEDGRAHLKEIVTGFETETGVVEVRQGLTPGEQVVVFNHFYLQDNDVVDTNWRKWTRRD